MFTKDKIEGLRNIVHDIAAETHKRRSDYISGLAQPSLKNDLRKLSACIDAATEQFSANCTESAFIFLEIALEKSSRINKRLHGRYEDVDFV